MRVVFVSILLVATTAANAFVLVLKPRSATTNSFSRPDRVDVTLGASTEDDLRAEADLLLRRAQELRASLPPIDEAKRVLTSNNMEGAGPNSPWRVPHDIVNGVGYRLQLDIGREEGTWMDPRWGASGRRIALTLDVLFSGTLADKVGQDSMVKDNVGGSSSSVYRLETAPAARLRNGVDKMACSGGSYRVDSGGNGKQTARFYVVVDGTPERGSPYGDVSIPRGLLYFSLPCFGGVSTLSSKEGIVTVRQMGWHTGWRREESRIIGTVYATPIEKAIIRDKF